MNWCVVLNNDYSFLNIVDFKRAVSLVITGKSEVVKYSEKTLKCSNGEEYKMPSVIRLIKLIRSIYRHKVPYSKKNVFIRDGQKCMYCGKKDDKLTIDHVIPASRGGETSFENCVASCKKCNVEKRDRTPSEAKMFLKKRPIAPTISEFFISKMKQLGVDKFLKDEGIF